MRRKNYLPYLKSAVSMVAIAAISVSVSCTSPEAYMEKAVFKGSSPG